MSEADAVLLATPKPQGWDQDLQALCAYRKSSLTTVIDRLSALPGVQTGVGVDPATLSHDEQLDAMEVQYAWGQLHAYLGELDKAIDRWQTARGLAVAGVPDALPRMDETLGVGLLHKAENDNDVYDTPGDRCLFPPLQATSYRETASARRAVTYFQQYLEKKPDDLEVRWLLNLAYMTLGGYPSSVPPAQLIPPSVFASTGTIGRFTDVAARAGLKVSSLAGGTIVDDFDNDGNLDVITSSMDVCEPLHYFHNNGDGRFTVRRRCCGSNA